MKLLLALAAMVLSAGGAWAQDACLPFASGDGDTPVIEARVNGQGPFLFIMDTAASGTTLDEAAVERLGLPRDAAMEAAQGLGGSMDVHLYQAALIEAGPLALHDAFVPSFPAPTLASHDIAGLAGIDLFGDRLIEWRPDARCIGVSATGGAPAGEGWTSIEAQWLQPWKIMLPVRLGDVEGLALLDTGAQHSVLNPDFANRTGLTEASGRLGPGGDIFGIDNRPLPLSEAEVTDVSIGNWRWSERTIKIGDLPVFARLGQAEGPVMILGMDWLAGRAFAVDYGARKVWLREP